jgi:hypothetical protein
MAQVNIQPGVEETIEGKSVGVDFNAPDKGHQEKVIMSTDIPGKKNEPEEKQNAESPKKKSHWLLWLIIILILIGAGAAAYFYFFTDKINFF